VPRYFFQTTNGELTPDADGIVLPDVSAARVAAIKLAGELLKDTPDLLSDTTAMKVVVTDEQARTLCTVLVTISDAEAAPS